jgi:hypothetical protein
LPFSLLSLKLLAVRPPSVLNLSPRQLAFASQAFPHLPEYFSFASDTVSVVVEPLALLGQSAQLVGSFLVPCLPVPVQTFSQLDTESPQSSALKPGILLGLGRGRLLDGYLLSQFHHLAALCFPVRLKIGPRPANLIAQINQLSVAIVKMGGELRFLFLDRFFSPANSNFVLKERRLLCRHGSRLDPEGILLALQGIVGLLRRYSWHAFGVFHDLAFPITRRGLHIVLDRNPKSLKFSQRVLPSD